MNSDDQRQQDHQDLVRARSLLVACARAGGYDDWSVDADPELRELPETARSREALAMRAAVVERNLPLAYSLANRRARYLRSVGFSVDVEECRQIAAVALTRAVARFQPERSDSVGAWAAVWITAELQRLTRDAVIGGDGIPADTLDELLGSHDPRRELARKVDAGRLLALLGDEGRRLLGEWAAGPGYSKRAAQQMGGQDRARDRVRRLLDDLRATVATGESPAGAIDPPCTSPDAGQLDLFAAIGDARASRPPGEGEAPRGVLE